MRRVSQFPFEASCNQEETGCLEHGLGDEAEAAVIARRQALVLEQPGWLRSTAQRRSLTPSRAAGLACGIEARPCPPTIGPGPPRSIRATSTAWTRCSGSVAPEPASQRPQGRAAG